MAGSPSYKIYRRGEYIAAVKHAEDAAQFVGAIGYGAEIRIGHSPKWAVWREGLETFSATESYDRVADVMAAREQKLQRESYEKAYGPGAYERAMETLAAKVAAALPPSASKE